MKAPVYHGPGSKSWADVPDPVILGATPKPLKLVTSGQLDRFATHHFQLKDIEAACDTFARAGQTGALKVVLAD